MDTARIAENPKERRMRRILAEAEDRYRNEMMDDEERLLLLARIKKLKRALTHRL